MTTTRPPAPSAFSTPTRHRSRHRRARRRGLALLVVAVLGGGGAATGYAWPTGPDEAHRDYLAAGAWPVQGQGSVAVGDEPAQSSPGQVPVPIASVAKVMTAYLVLQAHPLADGAPGFDLTVTRDDVADTAARRARDESLVPVRAGEVLTEREALAALLLPSANNVAIMLARRVAGSVAGFVDRMNATARALQMKQTTYTDPSGFDDGTRSTAADQVRLAQAAMREPTLAALVGRRDYQLPVAGTVHNTDTLLGTRGFVGIKTGSDDAAGGCFMFRTRRMVDGTPTDITGVVLGQPGDDLVAAGLAAGAQLADRVAAWP